MAKHTSNYSSNRSNILRLLVRLLISAVIALAAEDDSFFRRLQEESTTTQTCRSISEIVCETTVFSSFCKLLNDTVVIESLEDLNNRWTIFVPTNLALRSFGVESELVSSSNNSNNETDVDDLIDLLLYHFTPNRVNGVDLECGRSIVMENEENVTVVCGNASVSDIFLFGRGNTIEEGSPQVLVTDVVACNGLIHVISGVLRPEPLSEPVTQNVTEPVTGNVTESVTEPLTEQLPNNTNTENIEEEHDQKPHEDPERPVEDCKSIRKFTNSNSMIFAIDRFIRIRA